jgi:hypothetical protein
MPARRSSVLLSFHACRSFRRRRSLSRELLKPASDHRPIIARARQPGARSDAGEGLSTRDDGNRRFSRRRETQRGNRASIG